MKTHRCKSHSSLILLTVIALLAAGFSVGCGGKETSSPGGGKNGHSANGKDEVEVLDAFRTKNKRTGAIDRKSCQVDSDCGGEGATCANGTCYPAGDNCAQIKCGELERCEHGKTQGSSEEEKSVVFCVPNCNKAHQCGGKCSAEEGKECVDYQWVTPCKGGQKHCATAEGPICCAEGTTCVGGACVTLGNECDEANGIYCSISRYCDPTTKRCIKYADNSGVCIYRPVDIDKTEISLVWSSGGIAKSIYTTPLVADLDGDNVPEIIFLDWSAGAATDAALIAIRSTKNGPSKNADVVWLGGVGDNHREYDNPPSYEWLHSDVVPAVADLDGKGGPEIVTVVNKNDKAEAVVHPQAYIKAFHSDGSSYFQKEFPAKRYWADAAAVAIGDINHDGHPEIVVLGQVLDYQGNLLATLDFDQSKLTQGNYWGPFGEHPNNLISDIPILADVNLDGYLDIVDGLMVFLYKPEGSTSSKFVFEQPTLDSTTNEKAERPYTPDTREGVRKHGAVSAIANFNGPSSSYPQIVTLHNNVLYLADWRGKVLSKIDLPPMTGVSSIPPEKLSREGAPTIADFDGDDEPEIGVTYSEGYAVYDVVHENRAPKLKLRWQFKSEEPSDDITGSSVFDFDGDGSAEIVMVDRTSLYILSDKVRPHSPDDPSKADHVLIQIPNSTGGVFGASLEPVVADVDGDGHADIVTSSSDGIRVFSNPGNNWVPARPIWNQHAYSVTNINTDATVPREQKKNWQVSWLNNFRQNIQEGNPLLAPDLVLKVEPIFNNVCGEASPEQINLRFTLRNIGSVPVAAGKAPVLLEVTQNGSALVSETFRNRTELPPNGSESFSREFSLAEGSQFAAAPFDLKLTVDPDKTLRECDIKNNVFEVRNVQLNPPDATVTLNTTNNLLTTCLANPASVQIAVTVHNEGGSLLPVGTKVALYETVGSGKERKLGEVATTKAISGGDSETLTYKWHNFPSEYRNRLVTLRAVIDEEKEITECNESNNEPTFLFVCQQLG